MTFSLRRKRPTTARARRWLTRTAISLLGCGLWLHAGTVCGQSLSPYPTVRVIAPSPPAPPPQPHSSMTLQFVRDPQVMPATPPAVTPPVIQPVAAQGGKDKGMPAPKAGYETFEFRNLREVPGLEVLTRLESQEALFERMRQ